MCTRHRHVMWSYNPTMQACELFDKKGLPYRLHTFASGVVVIKFCGAAGLSPSFACVCVCVCAYACAFACLCVCGCVCVCVCVLFIYTHIYIVLTHARTHRLFAGSNV